MTNTRNINLGHAFSGSKLMFVDNELVINQINSLTFWEYILFFLFSCQQLDDKTSVSYFWAKLEAVLVFVLL